MKTIFVKPKDVERKWWLVDAEGQTLGRLASRITTVLRGKHKPIYSPHMETGDYVVVVNAEKVKITGNKREQKVYHRHSGYPGGLRCTTVIPVIPAA
jgi:large subunit ribosomal protein L13